MKPREACKAFGSVMTDRKFWLCVSSLGTHNMIKRLGQLMPVYFYAVADDLLSHGGAARMAVVFQVGVHVVIALFPAAVIILRGL